MPLIMAHKTGNSLNIARGSDRQTNLTNVQSTHPKKDIIDIEK